MGKYEIESPARYSAAMGVREIQKLASQKAAPPERVRRKMVRQLPFDWVMFSAPFQISRQWKAV
jgi:hypothetical protein